MKNNKETEGYLILDKMEDILDGTGIKICEKKEYVSNRFIVWEKVSSVSDKKWIIFDLKNQSIIAVFSGTKNPFDEYNDLDLAPLLAGDYCDFLNDKYVDKEMNKEWGKIDVQKRIEYHEKQLEILKSGDCFWNRHGNKVQSKRI